MTKAGTTVAQFLKISMDARSSAMGGAVTGQETNLTGVYWNPASIAGQNGIGIQFGSYDWLVAMKYQFATIGIDLGKNNVIGFNIVNLSSPRIWFALLQNHMVQEKNFLPMIYQLE